MANKQWSLMMDGSRTDLLTLGVIPSSGRKIRVPGLAGFGLFFEARPTVTFTANQETLYRTEQEKYAHPVAVGKHIATLKTGGLDVFRGPGRDKVRLDTGKMPQRAWVFPTDAELQDLHRECAGPAQSEGGVDHSHGARLDRMQRALRERGVIEGDPIMVRVGRALPYGGNAGYDCGGVLGLVFIQTAGANVSGTPPADTITAYYARGKSAMKIVGFMLDAWEMANATDSRSHFRVISPVEAPAAGSVPDWISTGMSAMSPLDHQLYSGGEFAAPFHQPVGAHNTDPVDATYKLLFGTIEERAAELGLSAAIVRDRQHAHGYSKGVPSVPYGVVLGLVDLSTMRHGMVGTWTDNELILERYTTRMEGKDLADLIELAALDMSEAVPAQVVQLRALNQMYYGGMYTTSFTLRQNPLYSTEAFAKATEHDASIANDVFIPRDVDIVDSVDVTFAQANAAANAYRLKYGARREIVVPGASGATKPFVDGPVYIRREAGVLVCYEDAGYTAQLSSEAVFSRFRKRRLPIIKAGTTFVNPKPSEGTYGDDVESASYEMFDASFGSIATDSSSASGGGDYRWSMESALDGTGQLKHPDEWNGELHLLAGAQKLPDVGRVFGGLLTNPFSMGLTKQAAIA